MTATTHVSTNESSSSVSTDEVGQAALRGARTTPDNRLDELSLMIQAYNEVTEKLQSSHESLEAQVTGLRQQLASTTRSDSGS